MEQGVDLMVQSLVLLFHFIQQPLGFSLSLTQDSLALGSSFFQQRINERFVRHGDQQASSAQPTDPDCELYAASSHCEQNQDRDGETEDDQRFWGNE